MHAISKIQLFQWINRIYHMKSTTPKNLLAKKKPWTSTNNKITTTKNPKSKKKKTIPPLQKKNPQKPHFDAALRA